MSEIWEEENVGKGRKRMLVIEEAKMAVKRRHGAENKIKGKKAETGGRGER